MARQNKKKTQNPLYVVTNQGKDVETASGPLDALIKSLGLAPAASFISHIIEEFIAQFTQFLAASINSYPLLVAAQAFLKQWIHTFEMLLARLGLGPVVPHRA